MADRVTPPPLQGPSAKEKKYDRQLRLWGANGQQALEEAHVLLLNSGAGVVGIETLKNLILPGVGHFTIVDGKKVEEEDLGVNFFLEESSLGKSRAEEYCKFLRGLNPEVEGHGIQKDVEEFLRKEDWEEYNLILVVAPVDVKKVLVKVREVASKKSIPVFYIHSVGFYSQFSIQLAASFPVVETHPDQEATEDLRLLKPWPELEAYFEKWSKGLRDDSLTAQEYGHVPYLALLHYYIGKWSKDNGGRKIETYKEKNELKVLIRNGAQKHNPGSGEENHEEAEAAVLKTLGVPSVPSGLKEILVDDECSKPRQDSADFWMIGNAIKSFVDKHGIHPLPGSIPDMKAMSADYIDLQNIYKAKARADVAEVTESVRDLEAKLDRKHQVSAKEIEAFCKGAAFVKLIHGSPLLVPSSVIDMSLSAKQVKLFAQQLSDEESLLPIHLAIMANDMVHSHPSTRPDQYTAELIEHIWTEEPTFDKASALERTRVILEEIERAGFGGELHNISALTGGMVAQEAIKVLTKQYIPVDNTCVFDGIKSKTQVFKI